MKRLLLLFISIVFLSGCNIMWDPATQTTNRVKMGMSLTEFNEIINSLPFDKRKTYPNSNGEPNIFLVGMVNGLTAYKMYDFNKGTGARDFTTVFFFDSSNKLVDIKRYYGNNQIP